MEGRHGGTEMTAESAVGTGSGESTGVAEKAARFSTLFFPCTYPARILRNAFNLSDANS